MASSKSAGGGTKAVKLDSIRITGSETRSKPDTHIVYAIEVSTKRHVWTVFRRYNDFIELQDVLKEKFRYKGTLPPKKAFGNMSPAFIEARRAGLEQYLKTLVMTADDKVLQSSAVDRFLEIRDHMSKDAASGDINNDWLGLYELAEENVAEAREVLAARDACLQNGEPTEKTSTEARKQLVYLGRKIAELTEMLQKAEANPEAHGVSDKEIIRRQDLLAKLRVEKEKAEQWMRTPKTGGSAGDRSSLFAGAEGYDQNGVPLAGSSTSSSAGGRRGPRVFGQETERTRGVDNQGLLKMQQEDMTQQDAMLDTLLGVIQRQKAIATTIGEELDSQEALLEKLDGQVDRTEATLIANMKKMKKIT